MLSAKWKWRNLQKFQTHLKVRHGTCNDRRNTYLHKLQHFFFLSYICVILSLMTFTPHIFWSTHAHTNWIASTESLSMHFIEMLSVVFLLRVPYDRVNRSQYQFNTMVVHFNAFKCAVDCNFHIIIVTFCFYYFQNGIMIVVTLKDNRKSKSQSDKSYGKRLPPQHSNRILDWIADTKALSKLLISNSFLLPKCRWTLFLRSFVHSFILAINSKRTNSILYNKVLFSSFKRIAWCQQFGQCRKYSSGS